MINEKKSGGSTLATKYVPSAVIAQPRPVRTAWVDGKFSLAKYVPVVFKHHITIRPPTNPLAYL